MEIKAEMQIVDKGTLFASGTVTLDGVLQIPGVKVLILHNEEGNVKYLTSLPRKKMADGTWKEIISIKDPQIWKDIQAEVLRAARAAAVKYISIKSGEIQADVHLCRPGGRVTAYATVHYKGIDISGIQVIDDGKDIKVHFPYDVVNGKIESIISPIGREMRESFFAVIQDAYRVQKEHERDFKRETERRKVM